MLIFKKARDGTLEIEGLKAIANTCDVSTEGVGGAKAFFEAKAQKVGNTCCAWMMGYNIFVEFSSLSSLSLIYSLLKTPSLSRKSKLSKKKRNWKKKRQKQEGLPSKRRLPCFTRTIIIVSTAIFLPLDYCACVCLLINYPLPPSTSCNCIRDACATGLS